MRETVAGGFETDSVASRFEAFALKLERAWPHRNAPCASEVKAAHTVLTLRQRAREGMALDRSIKQRPKKSGVRLRKLCRRFVHRPVG